ASITDYGIAGADGVSDRLTIDLSGGFFALSGGVFFQGGVGNGDAVRVVGSLDVVSAAFGAADSAFVRLVSRGRGLPVTFASTEVLALSAATIGSLGLRLPATADQAGLEDNGGTGPSFLASYNATFVPTVFREPTTTLSVDLGPGDDQFAARRTA